MSRFNEADENFRMALIQTFDEARPSFLAALDQTIAEVNPLMAEMSGFHKESIIQGALAFSDLDMIRSQLADLRPTTLFDYLDDEELTCIHVVILSYLLSLMLNDKARTRQELPPL